VGSVIRRAVLAAVLALVVTGAGTLPASAADPTAPPGFSPPPIPTPSAGGSSGPTYVITPGVGGSELPAPSDQKAVEKAKKADRARQQSGTKPPVHVDQKSDGGGTAVAGPQTPLRSQAVTHRNVGLLWRGFAALVVLLVMFEITAVRRRHFGTSSIR
jgi:hypothetical protein